MNKEIMTDYYRNNPKDILNEQLADDKPYHALIQKKSQRKTLCAPLSAKKHGNAISIWILSAMN